MSKLQTVRGTRDLLPPLSQHFRSIANQSFRMAQAYGFQLIETPIFEFSDVFHRTLGETSDVVSKETYDFVDRGGDSLTLRPEGTAGVARAFLSEGLNQSLPLKFYYSGPMFRHERPQKGRYRQFTQIGVEAMGFDNPLSDVEAISMAKDFLEACGLAQSCVLNLNTLGDLESRKVYREALIEYFSKYTAELSIDSQERLQKNPLRILDSKSEADQKICAGAPKFENYLNETSKAFFAKVLAGLEKNSIAYTLNSQLVRGLDYYSHTVFEFVTTQLGAQGTVLAGGRYDGLIQQMGGPLVPAVGWAAGLDRLADLIPMNHFENEPVKIAFASTDESADLEILKLSYETRKSLASEKVAALEIIYGTKLGKKLEKATKNGFKFVVILGESEIQKNTALIKNLDERTQDEVPLSEVAKVLAIKINSKI